MNSEEVLRGLALAPQRVVVLLVDDQQIICEALRHVLDGQPDIELHYCADPTAAVERAETVRPTVILLDLVMPDLDGLTLLGFLRAHEPTRDVPIIVLSTTEEAQTKAEAFARGANDYLVKLPDAVETVARIRHHSRGYIAQRERNAAFEALERSRQALAAELAEAAAYVRSLLPAPLDGGVRTDWRFIPSVQLGGDGLGYDWLDADTFALFVLDVSGHGVKSALLSMTAMNAVRTRSLPDVDFHDPARVLAGLNAAFQMEQYDMYFTVWYGVFDRRTRRIRFASAGHPPALLAHAGSGGVTLERLGDPGYTIGMVPEVDFENETAVVPPGSNLFVFSDGAYEITRPDGTVSRLDDLVEMLRAFDPAAGLASLDALEARLRDVRGQERFEDDVSLLQVRFDDGPGKDVHPADGPEGGAA